MLASYGTDHSRLQGENDSSARRPVCDRFRRDGRGQQILFRVQELRERGGADDVARGRFCGEAIGHLLCARLPCVLRGREVEVHARRHPFSSCFAIVCNWRFDVPS